MLLRMRNGGRLVVFVLVVRISQCLTAVSQKCSFSQQNRRQKVVNRGALRLCIPLIHSVSYLNCLGDLFGGAKPTKVPRGDGNVSQTSCIYQAVAKHAILFCKFTTQ